MFSFGMLLIFIGIMLSVFQQFVGINVVLYYAPEIFKNVGFDTNASLFQTIIVGAVNLAFTVVAILTVDRLGRRPLMLLGAGGIAVLHALLGAGFYFGYKGWPMLALVLLTMAFYALTLAPVMWVLLSELFPNRIRGAAMSISVLTLWITCWALAQFFPRINAALGDAGSFWLFSALCLVGFAFVWRFVPETKGKSLEEIERKLFGE